MGLLYWLIYQRLMQLSGAARMSFRAGISLLEDILGPRLCASLYTCQTLTLCGGTYTRLALSRAWHLRLSCCTEQCRNTST